MRVDPKVRHALLTKPSWFVIVFFLNLAAVGFFAFFRDQLLAYVGCFHTRIKLVTSSVGQTRSWSVLADFVETRRSA